MRVFAASIATAVVALSIGIVPAALAVDVHPEAPCSPTSGYTCAAPTTIMPLTPEGTCAIVGLDTELADPTFIDPSEDRIIGITMFVQYNPSSASTAICPLRLDRDNAEQMYDLLGSMLADGIEVEITTP